MLQLANIVDDERLLCPWKFNFPLHRLQKNTYIIYSWLHASYDMVCVGSNRKGGGVNKNYHMCGKKSCVGVLHRYFIYKL